MCVCMGGCPFVYAWFLCMCFFVFARIRYAKRYITLTHIHTHCSSTHVSVFFHIRYPTVWMPSALDLYVCVCVCVCVCYI